jgi:hypothetical protein
MKTADLSAAAPPCSSPPPAAPVAALRAVARIGEDFRLVSGSEDLVARVERALAELDHLFAVPGSGAHE